MAALHDESTSSSTAISSKATTSLESLFAAPKKALITAWGSSRLLCFDQVFAYIINVNKGQELSFTCATVIAFDQLPDDGEITDIKVNFDQTKAVLVGKYYSYCFTIPDTRVIHGAYRTGRATGDEIFENKISATLTTVGAIPNHTTIVKVKWLESSVTKKSQRYSDFLGILYSDSIIKIFDVKVPQKEHTFDFKSSIFGSVKEDHLKGVGLIKNIISFDFGPVFSKSYVTLFAVDSDSEMYYTGFAPSNLTIKTTPIIGPVLFKNSGVNSEPMSLTYIRHPKYDALSVFALTFDNGTISHVVAIPCKSLNFMMTGEPCLSLFIQDSINIEHSQIYEVMNDYSIAGEYLVSTCRHVYMISILPWLTELDRALQDDDYTPKDLPSIACQLFQLLSTTVVYQGVAILADPPIIEEAERWIIAYDSDCAIHSRLVLKLFQIPSAKNLSLAPQFSANDAPLIMAVPAPADVPRMKNDVPLSYEESLQLFSNIFKKLGDLASNNVQLTNDVIKKAESLLALNDKLISDDEILLKKIVNVADESQALQPRIVKYTNVSEKLIRRCDRIYNSIPREQLPDAHLENEARLYKMKKALQVALSEASESSMNAIMLRSEHIRRQPSFQPSISAAQFMLTRSGLHADELSKETEKLASKVGKLSTIAEYAKRMEA